MPRHTRPTSTCLARQRPGGGLSPWATGDAWSGRRGRRRRSDPACGRRARCSVAGANPRARRRREHRAQVPVDPAPADRSPKRSGQDHVDLPDRPLRQRPALVRATTTIAPVVARGPVIDACLVAAVAVIAAPPQLGVERVEDRGPQGPDLLPADQRTDMFATQRLVCRQGRRLDLQELEVLVEELIDRRCGRGVLLLVDLRRQPTQHPLGLLLRLRSGRDELTQEVPLPADRIDSGVDDDP